MNISLKIIIYKLNIIYYINSYKNLIKNILKIKLYNLDKLNSSSKGKKLFDEIYYIFNNILNNKLNTILNTILENIKSKLYNKNKLDNLDTYLDTYLNTILNTKLNTVNLRKNTLFNKLNLKISFKNNIFKIFDEIKNYDVKELESFFINF